MKLFSIFFVAIALALSNAQAQSSTTVDWSNSNLTAFKDGGGNALSQGVAATNKDGMLVQLGYFTGATVANKFAGAWVPLTGVTGLPRTTIGDSPANAGLGSGRIGFNTFFIANSADVHVYDSGDPGQYTTRSSVNITGTTMPPDQQLLAIRFYDTSDGASGHYNTVSSGSWVWNAPTPISPIVTIDLANSTLEFEDNANAFKTSLAVPTPPPTPTPSPTPSPSSTPTPSPAESTTPGPSSTPSPSSSPSATASPTSTPTATPTATPIAVSQLLNLSARKVVGTGTDVTIGGFIVTGSEKKTVLLRGLGPSLAPPFAANAVLADPTLELRQADQTLLASNNNWQDSQASEIAATGIPPGNSLEAAIVFRLPAKTAATGGAGYTAILAGNNGGTGQGLLELYDLDQAANSTLANISTRGFVGTGDNLLIGGFFPGPVGNAPLKVLVRALGPSLVNAGVADALSDPLLELHDSNGDLVGQANDNWQEGPNSNEIASILPPSDPHESAILVTLPPGEHGYTAVVRSANNATGVALVEIYALP